MAWLSGVTANPTLHQGNSLRLSSCPQRVDPPLLTSGGRIAIASYPDLMADWDEKANAGLDPKEVPHRRNQKVAWRCSECGHHWEAAPDKRVTGRGCPAAALHDGNNLEERYPEIAAEWDYDSLANEGLAPSDVTPAAPRQGRGWRCAECGHRWTTTVANRTMLGQGCPRWRRHNGNTVSERNPEIAAEWDWDSAENTGASPLDVSPSSEVQRGWICSVCGHRWSAAPRGRCYAGHGCPRRLLHHGNSLAERFPEVAAQWDYSAAANAGLAPTDVTPFHNELRAWHHDVCGHRWLAAPALQVRNWSRTCSVCSFCSRWSVEKIRTVLATMKVDVLSLDGDEREQVLRQTGLRYTSSRGRIILEAIRVGLLSNEDYQAFLTDTDDSRWLTDKLARDPVLFNALPRPAVPSKLRKQIYAYDSHRCRLCGQEDQLSLDHFVPWLLGGPTEVDNLWTVCLPCNRGKWFRMPTVSTVAKWQASGRTLPALYVELNLGKATKGPESTATTRQ